MAMAYQTLIFPNVTHLRFLRLSLFAYFQQYSPASSTLLLWPCKFFHTIFLSPSKVCHPLTWLLIIAQCSLGFPSRLSLLFFLTRLIACTYLSQATYLILSLLSLILLIDITHVLPSLRHALGVRQIISQDNSPRHSLASYRLLLHTFPHYDTTFTVNSHFKHFPF